ncbi:EpsG family protein [Aestuariibacter sp. AA17]|uniref:EpsG family protein n=1 Tax=Fluctibacter corallii TaxID=2984329 RepID=A0ABT3ADD6_9ALTE|nr:EpsG family protein [Aestuariibacter sp. AA17]MCV2886688.1 EpsG family protein [Aestuariibacter sp. AA17]
MIFHYLYLTLFCVIAATFFDEKVVARGQQIRFWQTLLFIFLVQITVLYVFRDIRTDTFRYVTRLHTYAEQDLVFTLFNGGKEFGFTLLTWCFAHLGLGDRTYLFVVFWLGLLPFVQALKRLYGQGWGYMLLVYAMFPFFISYFASGLRQAVSMAIGYWVVVNYFAHRRVIFATVGLLIASLFHVSSLVILPILLGMHAFEKTLSLSRVLMIWVGVVCISMLGLNEQLLGFMSGFFDEGSRYQYYIDQDKISQIQAQMNYRTGFRWDFTLFSIIPVLYVLYFERRAGIDLWLLKFYLLLNCAFQLMSFTPSNDRFAALSWFYIPTLLVHSQFYSRMWASSKAAYYVLLASGLGLLVLFNNRYFAA